MSVRLRAVTWNLRCGGVDGPSEQRFHQQADILADLAPDVLALQECTFWDEGEERRLHWMCRALEMAPVAMVRDGIGDGRNHTALLYRPSRLRLLGHRTTGVGVFHHALIHARLRPVQAGDDDSLDLLALATHLTHTDGESRLREAQWLTDHAGPFPRTPDHALLLGDLNTSGIHDQDPDDWAAIPRNLHARYRHLTDDGRFGGMDRRALQLLITSGWHEPQTHLGTPREPTVGYAYDNEKVPLTLDHILYRGFTPRAYATHDTPHARDASDHLPTVLDADLP
ncbi:endonuclease/exonuclease/phosphatase family protein [Streptomyces sp. NPDC000594]|uniref:endonuclease/exonuclease/phosphatase family protein n=1 Tax=Streptomyces sp. NPDC000594 TaxID=3154261 RepID=UPI0033312B4F